MAEKKIPRFANDNARCDGVIKTRVGPVWCERREECLRYRAERSETDRQVFIVVESDDGTCSEFWGF
jgi:hypothetical protein